MLHRQCELEEGAVYFFVSLFYYLLIHQSQPHKAGRRQFHRLAMQYDHRDMISIENVLRCLLERPDFLI